MMYSIRFCFVCLGALLFAIDAKAGTAEDCNQSANQELRIKACTQFILENPQNASLAVAYTFRGAAYSASGDTVHALADFNEALKRKPDLYEAVYERGIAYARIHDNQRMLQDTERTVQLNPSDWRGYNLRGNANKNLGELRSRHRRLQRSSAAQSKTPVAVAQSMRTLYCPEQTGPCAFKLQ